MSRKRSVEKYAINYREMATKMDQDFPLVRTPGLHPQPRMQITELHQHDCLEIGYCHSGAGIFTVDDKVFSYGPGDVVVVSEYERHCACSNAGATIHGMYLWTKPAQLLGITVAEPLLVRTDRLAGPKFPNVFSNSAYPKIAMLVRELFHELVNEAPGYRSVVRGLMQALLGKLQYVDGAGSWTPREKSQFWMDRVAPALHYMAEHYALKITVEDLAERCELSEPHFRRMFRRAVGIPAVQYLAQLRIRMAIALLEGTDMPITQVGETVGYEALCSFNRNFKQVAGRSPRDWRRQRRNVRLAETQDF